MVLNPMEQGVASNLKRIHAVVLNYQTADLSIDCCRSLMANLDSKTDSIVIVDNNSQDDSLSHLYLFSNQSEFAVDVLALDHNGGFSYGMNHGIKYQDAEYYLLLNSDTIVKEKSVAHLLQTAAQDSRIGIVGPMLTGKDGARQESQFRKIKPTTILCNSVGILSSMFPSNTISAQPGSGQADWVSFAAVLIKREVIATAGLMDEGFFMYFEDADFCLKAAGKGWTIAYCPDSVIIHLRGQSSPVKRILSDGGRLPRYFYESRTRYFKKWFGFTGFIQANLLDSLEIVLRRFKKHVMKKSIGFVRRGFADIWINTFEKRND